MGGLVWWLQVPLVKYEFPKKNTLSVKITDKIYCSTVDSIMVRKGVSYFLGVYILA